MDAYKRQDELVGLFRKRGRPFLAIMPYRHRYRCEKCGVERGDSLFHFEDPGVPCAADGPRMMWGVPTGMWFELNASKLHAILAHDEEPDDAFLMLLEGAVRRGEKT